jgi:hypothetical protein
MHIFLMHPMHIFENTSETLFILCFHRLNAYACIFIPHLDMLETSDLFNLNVHPGRG